MPIKDPRKIILKAGEDDAGVRLDVYVADKAQISRSFAKKLIEDGQVSVNGALDKPASKLSFGDDIVIDVPTPTEAKAIAQDIPLDVLYEDSSIIVLNKPAGMVVHPAAGHQTGTLVNALLAHCKDLSGIGGELRAGIVHRLDVGTSGVMVAAKGDDAHRSLSAQFKARTVKKEYVALVVGKLRSDSGTFDAGIGRSFRDRKKFSAKTRKARTAITEWKVLERFGTDASLVSIGLKTGRTHQIRVHFSEAGHPLVGDATYGGAKLKNRIKNAAALTAMDDLKRPALHAASLSFAHPKTGEIIKFSAKLPNDLELLVKSMRKIYSLPKHIPSSKRAKK